MSLSSISIIIPTLNEAEALPATLAASRSALPEAEVIVADGGSTDATVKIALAHRAQVVFGPRGRGPQCRSGAAAARGDLLLFLHADTLLPPDAGRVLAEAFARSEMQIGTFRLSFDRPGPFLAACSWFTRFDSVFTRFGDQGITVRRAFHDELDGFAPCRCLRTWISSVARGAAHAFGHSPPRCALPHAGSDNTAPCASNSATPCCCSAF